MSLSPPELARVTAELAALVGARVQKVAIPAERSVALELWQPGRPTTLLLDASPGLARVGVVERRPPSPVPPLGFQGQLRSHLTGARVEAITAEPASRTVVVRFSTIDGERQLVATLDPRGGDVVLLDERGLLIGAGRSDRSRFAQFPEATPRGKPWQVPGPIPSGKALDRFATLPAPTDAVPFPVSAAIEALFAGETTERRLDAGATTLQAALKAARKRAERTLAKIDEDARRVEEASRYQRLGDLLKPVAARLKRGATEARVTEYGEEGPVEVVVPLQPQLDGRGNVERYYKLHRRLTRATGVVAERHRVLRDRLARLDALNVRLEAATDPETVEALSDEARTQGLIGARATVERPVADVRLPYRTFTSASGRAIRVGRNAKGNDALTFGHARGNDLWLHARGLTGAHVVVPGIGADGPDEQTLLDAATLAAHFSAGRGELVVDVAWTRRKFVGKPKKAPVGAVTVTQEKVFALRADPGRLERLLASEVVEGGGAVGT